MTTQEKTLLVSYRKNGYGYKKIADLMGLSENTVKTYCKRNNLAGTLAGSGPRGKVTRCKQCGAPLVQTVGRKPKVFCSSLCRNKWWNNHPNMIQHRDGQNITCKNCGIELRISKNSTQRYCSHACYISDRFHGGVVR